MTGDLDDALVSPRSLASLVADSASVRGWLSLGATRIPVESLGWSEEMGRAAYRRAELWVNRQGDVRVSWDIQRYRQWPSPQVGDDLTLAVNGREFAYRISLVEDVPANWAEQPLENVAKDDLAVVVTAGATRLVIWAVPAWR